MCQKLLPTFCIHYFPRHLIQDDTSCLLTFCRFNGSCPRTTTTLSPACLSHPRQRPVSAAVTTFMLSNLFLIISCLASQQKTKWLPAPSKLLSSQESQQTAGSCLSSSLHRPQASQEVTENFLQGLQTWQMAKILEIKLVTVLQQPHLVQIQKLSAYPSGTGGRQCIITMVTNTIGKTPQCTMLQKLSKCEVKAAHCGSFNIFLPLRFYV